MALDFIRFQTLLEQAAKHDNDVYESGYDYCLSRILKEVEMDILAHFKGDTDRYR